MIHYHGTPITPRAELLTLRGAHFCVSHANPSDVGVCHDIGQSVMLDNGAYSAWTQGRETDWDAYYEWTDRWFAYPTTWAVIPDVIDGDENANDALVKEWPHGQRGAPVWHMHERLDRLIQMCEEWSLVCIGSSGEYAQLRTPRWHMRMREAFDTIVDERGRTRNKIHMLRGLALRKGPYPFYSADSVDVARNANRGNGVRRSRVEMVREIDSSQPPPTFPRRPKDEQLWSA